MKLVIICAQGLRSSDSLSKGTRYSELAIEEEKIRIKAVTPVRSLEYSISVKMTVLSRSC
jgi:hypothetical protein